MHLSFLRTAVTLSFLLLFAVIASGEPEVIKAHDLLRIHIGIGFNAAQLCEVDDKGFVKLEAFSLAVKGLSIEQACVMIAERYAAGWHMKASNLRISIEVMQRTISISGQVNTPVVIPYTKNITILGALASAGGLTKTPAQSVITIIRGPQIMVIDIGMTDNDKVRAPGLEPGDQVIVK